MTINILVTAITNESKYEYFINGEEYIGELKKFGNMWFLIHEHNFSETVACWPGYRPVAITLFESYLSQNKLPKLDYNLNIELFEE